MLKELFNKFPKLATYIIASLFVGFIFLFTLPDPVNAVAFIGCLCFPTFYLVYKLYTARDKKE